MKVYHAYYSPTGGTRKVSEILSGVISKDVEEIDLLKKDCAAPPFEREDVCVISVPAFGGRVPFDAAKKFRNFHARGARAVIVAVFGNRAVDDTLLELFDLASEAGFRVIAAVEAVAEHSLVCLYGKNRPDEEDREQLYAFGKQILEKLKLEETLSFSIPGNRPYKEYRPSAMRPTVDGSCIDCKRCAIECPVSAIPEDNVKTVDSTRCFSCMHCTFVCPMGARHNSPLVTKSLTERLRPLCSEKKPNRLYL